MIQKPRDASDVLQAVRDALSAGQSLEIAGHGGKRSVGRPVASNAVLDLGALDRVVAYEPNELVLTVEAGASLDCVEALLAGRNQEFAFEPMRPAALLGMAPGGTQGGTIGGMIGAGLAGPRRIKAGGVRDHLLGIAAVSGFGEAFKAGGRVVKNVTGYDVCKLIAGSWGTLAVMTEVTLKVMPKAETEVTLVLRGLDDLRAGEAMVAAMRSPFDVSGAAHLPRAVLHAGPVDNALAPLGEDSATLLRLEGIEASVSHRARALAVVLKPLAPADILKDSHQSRALWSAVRDVQPFSAKSRLGAWTVWRIVCPPASGIGFGKALARETGGDVIYDWGGGLIWAALPASRDGQAGLIRSRLKAIGGHATLIRADEALRRRVPVFEPQPAGLAALEERVRASFDPQRIFNPGRMVRLATDAAQMAGAGA